MPTYDYYCKECDNIEEVIHSIKNTSAQKCSKCGCRMKRQISGGGHVIIKCGTTDNIKETEHRKKIKDPERANKMRKQAFGSSDVGPPRDKPDPRHIVKKGKTIGGQQMEVDKKELIKSLAKDDYAVKIAKDTLNKKSN
jgi:putative FmdB family regulatory protein